MAINMLKTAIAVQRNPAFSSRSRDLVALPSSVTSLFDFTLTLKLSIDKNDWRTTRELQECFSYSTSYQQETYSKLYLGEPGYKSPLTSAYGRERILLKNNLCPACLHHQQHRTISSTTYQKYFSPESPPIAFAQEVFEKIYAVTGLPWWGSIMVTTFLLRGCVTLPLSIYSAHILARVENLQPEIIQLSQRLKLEVKQAVKEFGWKESLARRKFNATMKKLIRELYVRDNCHPFKASLVMWVQLPMWVCLSFALRNMSGYMPYKGVEAAVLCPEMTTEGLLWFINLTVPDSTWILPICLGMLNFIIVEMHTLKEGQPTRFQKIVTNGLKVISVIMVPIGAAVPSCLCLYWTSSSLFGLLQNITMKLPKVRRTLRIPKTQSESVTPFRDMYNIAKTKYRWKKKKDQQD